MKRLSTRIQEIEKILRGDYIYVDKTRLIQNLIQKEGCYLLSRPRRFGKTLLLTTLKSIFEGKKELFKDCYLYRSGYSWERHPVLHLNFAQILRSSAQELTDSLERALIEIAQSYGLSIPIPSLSEGLATLVKSLAKKGKVVILVDEYDKPLADNLDNREVVEANHNVLKAFYQTLKELKPHVRLAFVTGVSKFAQSSLFSGLNTIEDLTMDPSYANILGYTEKEIHEHFSEYIMKIVNNRMRAEPNMNEEILLKEMRQWYNGYRFTAEEETVYNPHSVMKFLTHGKFENYWFETGSPAFLVEQIKKAPIITTKFSGANARRSNLLDIQDFKNPDLMALMWQTGYLTIQKYDPKTDFYQLDFPNKEVRESFFEYLIKKLAQAVPSDINVLTYECKRQLENKEFFAFFESVNVFFAKVAYYLSLSAPEGSYHAIFLILLEAMGLKVHPEVATNIGRIDLLIKTPKTFYVFECKMDKSTEEALKQIERKKYREKYLKEDKEVVALGVNFSSITRNIASWKTILYSPSGEIKEELSNPS